MYIFGNGMGSQQVHTVLATEPEFRSRGGAWS